MPVLSNRINPKLKNEEIVPNIAEAFRRAAEIKPKYRTIRDLWSEQYGGFDVSTSFSHPNPNQPGREMLSTQIFMEAVEQSGLPDLRGLVVAHDLGLPHKDSPLGYTLEMAGFSNNQQRNLLKILANDVPYALQNGERLHVADPYKVSTILRSQFEHGGIVINERIEEIVKLLLLFDKRAAVTGPGSGMTRLLAVRDAQLRLVGLDHKKEYAASSMIDVYADALERFDHDHGKRFWEIPLSDRFEPREVEYASIIDRLPGSYIPLAQLRGIYQGVNEGGKDRQGLRMPVAFNGRTFAFSIADTKKLFGGLDFEIDVRADGLAFIAKKDIYEAMRANIVMPTVPTMMLVDCVGSQVPQVGAQDWKKYAHRQAERMARWLQMDAGYVRDLVPTTYGLEALGVRMPDGVVHHGFFMNYLTFGEVNMKKAFTEGNYYEAEYGAVIETPTDLAKCLVRD